MWTIADNGILVNMEAVRSVGIELSDDRQFVEVQVRWANDGERFPIVTLVVQDYGGTKQAMAAGETVVDFIREKLIADGKVLRLPTLTPPNTSSEDSENRAPD